MDRGGEAGVDLFNPPPPGGGGTRSVTEGEDTKRLINERETSGAALTAPSDAFGATSPLAGED